MLALVFALGACEQEPVQQLDEIPIEELRLMLKGYPGDWRGDSDRSKGVPEPPAEKPIPAGAKWVDLTAVDELTLGGAPLKDVITKRRSRREFSTAALGLDELSFLLWSAQGVTDESHGFRSAPSAGGRYPLETYIAVNRVEGLAPGAYRYLPATQQLLVVREDAELAAQLQTACYGESMPSDAAAVVIFAAVPYRTEWKYAYLAHRMIAMEVGHAGQNLYLAAESIDAGACAMLGYDQASVDGLIEVDGSDEFAVYLVCIGKPVKE